jgi:hypothetical protein
MKALKDLFPHLLRFLSDEYDDTSMAVFPFLTEVLSQVMSQIYMFDSIVPSIREEKENPAA